MALADPLVLPGLVRRRALPALDPYPERADPQPHWLDRIADLLTTPLVLVRTGAEEVAARRRVQAIAAREESLRAEGETGLRDAVAEVRVALRREGLTGPAVTSALALAREGAHRTLGLRPHDVQLLGALALLGGRIAEMDTGEGKTLTAALAASVAGLAGVPVHVVTVNDYLAERDAADLQPLYAWFGLRVGLVTHVVPRHERVAAYAADVVYASNKEIAFDHLRDRVLLGGRCNPANLKVARMFGRDAARPVMRGLHFAIVDEADSVMIDEARTPLILSEETDQAAEQAWAEQAHALADRLEQGRDWRLIAGEHRIELRRAGRDRLERLGAEVGGIWQGRVRREDAVQKALSARKVYRRGEHYLVRDGKVEIVDEYTGRVMADRSWNDGLHQLIEHKEGCEITPRKLTLARLTYQRFFRRYLRLAGMTGTARETKAEFWSVYRLAVMRIPPNTPSRMDRWPTRLCPTLAAKRALVAHRAEALACAGRAVLIGVRSVAEAQALSEALQGAGLDHQVLSAEHDREEAAIIARAGEPGQVTVATNMAGRGVDIPVAPSVLAQGGLHVILTERHDAGRIDRQLAGRTARRGEPGSVEAILSLQDPLLQGVPRHPLRLVAGAGTPLGRRAAQALIHAAQRRAERLHHQARRDLLRQDQKLGEILAFSGRGE